MSVHVKKVPEYPLQKCGFGRKQKEKNKLRGSSRNERK